MTNPLVIRADASTQIGTGHAMRCLALAQAWQSAEGETIFVTAMKAPALEARLKDEGIRVIHLSTYPGGVEDAAQTAELAHQTNAQWIVVDGYQFGDSYQRVIKRSGLRLLFVDDYGHSASYCADIVLNQNIYAHEGLYADREAQTRLLLGTPYVLLRQEFLRWRGYGRQNLSGAPKVLVTLGGSDVANVTLKVVHGLQLAAVDDLQASVVVGSAYPHFEELEMAVRNYPFVRLERNVLDMPRLMAWADVAVSAAGTTCWELAFMGLPSLIMVLADNQRLVAEKLDAAGAAVLVGWGEQVSPVEVSEALVQLLASQERRARMTVLGQNIVDGQGSARVRKHMVGQNIRLRRAREGDCRLLWEWRNDPKVLAASFSSEPVTWTRHIDWFESRMTNPNCILLVAVNSEDIPVGQVRLDVLDNEIRFSISVDREFRGKGYGSEMIRLARPEALSISNGRLISAYVKPDNKASLRSFGKAGFKEYRKVLFDEQEALHLVLGEP